MIAVERQMGKFASAVAAHAITIPVEVVNIAPDNIDRAAHIGWAIATSARTIDIRGDGNAGPLIVFVASFRPCCLCWKQSE